VANLSPSSAFVARNDADSTDEHGRRVTRRKVTDPDEADRIMRAWAGG
jgi:hypothetical protein